MLPVISIIVPVFNNAQEIVRCLDSLLSQTLQEIEIIAVDDGSSDGSGDILDTYAEKYQRIHVVHQQNLGVTAARLSGIAVASGSFIGFTDGDDYVEPQMFQQLYENAVAYHADISHCGYQMCFPDGRVSYFHNTGCIEQQDGVAALKELLSGSRIEPGLCNKLFHKSLFQSLLQNNIMPVEIKINEDLLMNFFLFSRAENTVFEDVCPYHYIVRYTSASRQKLNSHKIFDPIRVKDIIRQETVKELKDISQVAYLNTCINVYNSLLFTSDSHSNEMAQVATKIKAESKQLLSRKRRVMAEMINHFPGIYGFIYRFYTRYIQKNPYV